MQKYKYSIEDAEMQTEYCDAGPWRSYRLDTHGNSLHECLVNATITAVDQDGGELYTESLVACGDPLWSEAEKKINKAMDKKDKKVWRFA